MIDHYAELYDFWTKEINRIVVYNKLQYKEAELSNKEKEIILGLEEFGYFDFVDSYQDSCILRTTTSKSAKSAKSDAFRDVRSVLDKYFNRKEYNKFTLRIDVAKYLIGKSKRFQLDLPLLIRNLWGISPNNKQKK